MRFNPKILIPSLIASLIIAVLGPFTFATFCGPILAISVGILTGYLSARYSPYVSDATGGALRQNPLPCFIAAAILYIGQLAGGIAWSIVHLDVPTYNTNIARDIVNTCSIGLFNVLAVLSAWGITAALLRPAKNATQAQQTASPKQQRSALGVTLVTIPLLLCYLASTVYLNIQRSFVAEIVVPAPTPTTSAATAISATATPTLEPSPTAAPTACDLMQSGHLYYATSTTISPKSSIPTGILLNHGQLHEVSCIDGQVQDKILASGYNFTVSSNGQYFQYLSDSMSAVLLNIKTGAKLTYLQHQIGYCASWSPDSSQISYLTLSRTLYMYNRLTGATRFLYQAPWGDYTPAGTVWGELDCAQWMSPTSYIINRYQPPLPESFVGGNFLSSDSTISVDNGKTVELSTAYDAQWNVVYTEPDGYESLLTGPLPGTEGIYTQYYVWLASKPLAKAQQIQCYERYNGGDCLVLGFVPGAHQFYTLEKDATTSKYAFNFYDSATLTKQMSIPAPDSLATNQSIEVLFNGMLIKSATSYLFVYFCCQSNPSIVFSDLSTGYIVQVVDDTESPSPDELQPLLWLPS